MESSAYGHVVAGKLRTVFGGDALSADYVLELLERYGSHSIELFELIARLKEAAYDCRHLGVFEAVRPMIALADQLEYSKLAPRCVLAVVKISNYIQYNTTHSINCRGCPFNLS